MKQFAYLTIHLPTQRTFLNKTECKLTLQEFYHMMCKWNEQNPSVWLYSPIPEERPQ